MGLFTTRPEHLLELSFQAGHQLNSSRKTQLEPQKQGPIQGLVVTSIHQYRDLRNPSFSAASEKKAAAEIQEHSLLDEK